MFAALTDEGIQLLAEINAGRATSTTLASRLRVSRPTVARILASLRKKGIRISSRRTEVGWFYELSPAIDPRLERIVGMSPLGRKARILKSHDAELVQYLESKSRKRSRTVKAEN